MIYWNPYLETLSRERLPELELNSFRKLFQYAKEHSRFYRQRYVTKEDPRRLPLLDEEDLRAAQEGTGRSLLTDRDDASPVLTTLVRRGTA